MNRYSWKRTVLRRWRKNHVACSPDIPADAVAWNRAALSPQEGTDND